MKLSRDDCRTNKSATPSAIVRSRCRRAPAETEVEMTSGNGFLRDSIINAIGRRMENAAENRFDSLRSGENRRISLSSVQSGRFPAAINTVTFYDVPFWTLISVEIRTHWRRLKVFTEIIQLLRKWSWIHLRFRSTFERLLLSNRHQSRRSPMANYGV